MTTPYRTKKTGQSADFSIPLPQHHQVFTKHQVTIMANTATTGTVAPKFKPYAEGNGRLSPVYNAAGTAALSATISASSTETFVFECDAESLEFDVTGLNGTVDVYTTSW